MGHEPVLVCSLAISHRNEVDGSNRVEVAGVVEEEMRDYVRVRIVRALNGQRLNTRGGWYPRKIVTIDRRPLR